MNRYQVAIGGLGLAAATFGAGLFVGRWTDGDMHDGSEAHMHGSADAMQMAGMDGQAMEAQMRAILGDEAYQRMVDSMNSMDAGAAHMGMMMAHMGMDSNGMMK